MKRLALAIISLSIALTHFTSAEDVDGKQTTPARPQRRQAPPNTTAARTPGGQVRNYGAPQGGRGYPNTLRPQGQFQHADRRFYPGVTRQAGVPQSSTSLYRTRTMDPAQSGISNASQPWRNGDGHRDWQNHGRGGDEQWKDRNGASSEVNRNRWNGNRQWDRTSRDRDWWRSHYHRFARFGGGCYYWDAGFWYPAYGYDPYFTAYTYDAPVYAYNDLDPGQVIANVQAELQRGGYYRGVLDGEFGPMTRRALLDFQQDNGLPVTGEIDEATLDALGLR